MCVRVIRRVRSSAGDETARMFDDGCVGHMFLMWGTWAVNVSVSPRVESVSVLRVLVKCEPPEDAARL